MKYQFQAYPGHERILPIRSSSPAIQDDSNGLLAVIFGPDEMTGNPRSDLLLETRLDNPMLQEYIRNHFQREQQEGVKLDDADLALDFSKDSFESEMAYADRLRQLSIME